MSRRPCFVYFIQRGLDGAIKIGVSGNPAERMRDLSTMEVDDLRLLLAIDGSYEEETALHRRFHRLRLRGEWFAPDGALLEFISWLREHPSELVSRLSAEQEVERAESRRLREHNVDAMYEIMEAAIEVFGGTASFARALGKPERDVRQRLYREVVGGHPRHVPMDWLAYLESHPVAFNYYIAHLSILMGFEIPKRKSDGSLIYEGPFLPWALRLMEQGAGFPAGSLDDDLCLQVLLRVYRNRNHELPAGSRA